MMVFIVPSNSFAQSREQLESDLAKLEAQIKELNNSIAKTKEQGVSLKNDISILEKKIKESKLKIQSHDKAILKLNQSIKEKDKNLTFLNQKMQREKESLAQILRKTNHIEQYSIVDFSLQSDSLSSFFSDLDSFATLNSSLNKSFSQIRELQGEITEVKNQLLDEKDEETQKKIAQENEKKQVERNQNEKNNLLAVTKNQESQYKKVLAEREKEASQIRARLFDLRDVTAISFGQAYDLAVSASSKTGVRPALILAILMQESSLGINVGACNLRDMGTGDGVSIKSGEFRSRVMNPTRDVATFSDITSRLGRDTSKTPVSCWIPAYSGGKPVGWGGAMGPSQFIPSTWKLFEDRIENAVGAKIADPWNPSHAIMATAMYLADLGAISGNEVTERNAACKYYSGRSCSSSSAGAGYGNSVMKKLYATQADIDKLQR